MVDRDACEARNSVRGQESFVIGEEEEEEVTGQSSLVIGEEEEEEEEVTGQSSFVIGEEEEEEVNSHSSSGFAERLRPDKLVIGEDPNIKNVVPGAGLWAKIR